MDPIGMRKERFTAITTYSRGESEVVGARNGEHRRRAENEHGNEKYEDRAPGRLRGDNTTKVT